MAFYNNKKIVFSPKVFINPSVGEFMTVNIGIKEASQSANTFLQISATIFDENDTIVEYRNTRMTDTVQLKVLMNTCIAIKTSGNMETDECDFPPRLYDGDMFVYMVNDSLIPSTETAEIQFMNVT